MTKPYKTVVRLWDSKIRDYYSQSIELTIDWQACAEYLAKRATNNKSGKAKLLNGKICGKLVKP